MKFSEYPEKAPAFFLLLIVLLLAACQGERDSSGSSQDPAADEPIPAAEEATAVSHEGIDVSHYQGVVDWQAVRSAGIVFAFAKATEGREDVDPQLAANWQGMKEAGIVRGAYHFFYPNIDALAQAEHFIATVTLEPGDLPPVLDIELSEQMDAQTIDDDVARWLETVAAHYGVRPILYSDRHFIESYLSKGFEQYPLWLAEYQDEAPDPSAWSAWNDWTLWQYTQNGTVEGVNGEVDRNRFEGSEDEWQSLSVEGPAATVAD